MSINAIGESSYYQAVANAGSATSTSTVATATDATNFALQMATAINSGSENIDPSSPVDALMGTVLNGLLTDMPTDEAGLTPLLMLLCAMISSGGESNELAMRLMSAIAAMDDSEPLRRAVMDSDFEPEVLDEVNATVFRAAESNYPYEAWKPCTPELYSDESNRSAEVYQQVINQFDVENNDRYLNNKQGNGDTYCNIFLWDVTSAMGAEIPHYTDANAAPVAYADRQKGDVAMTANRIYDWLANTGEEYGWYRVSAEEAQNYANQGHPAVTAWRNSGGHGHVQVVAPSDGAYDPQTGVMVAQAGGKRLAYAPITDVFRGSALENVAYYVHL